MSRTGWPPSAVRGERDGYGRGAFEKQISGQDNQTAASGVAHRSVSQSPEVRIGPNAAAQPALSNAL